MRTHTAKRWPSMNQDATSYQVPCLLLPCSWISQIPEVKLKKFHFRRWPIANIPGLQLSGKARRTRGRHTFRQSLVAHEAEDPPVVETHESPARLSWSAQRFRRHLDAAARRRVNRSGSPSDRGLEPGEGRVAYYGNKKEARQENPGQKSTISFNAAALARGTNNLDIHSRDLI
ncbi:uncharacterized protein LOC144581584 [Callithrix jacchus]